MGDAIYASVRRATPPRETVAPLRAFDSGGSGSDILCTPRLSLAAAPPSESDRRQWWLMNGTHVFALTPRFVGRA